jgi:peptide/nickel transport system substrate-binding protein
MKKSKLFSTMAAIGLILAACSSPAAPTEAPKAAAPTEAPKAAPTEAPKAAPTEPIKVVEATATAVPTAVPEAKYKEAPEFADMVKAGKLKPVKERLPDNPVITPLRESVGKYGGTLQTASWWPEVGNVQLYFAVEAPIKWKDDLTGYEPALAESYVWSEDGKTFTLKLRKGLKWSDGTPYTSADWKFWWEDLVKNDEYKAISKPSYLRKTDGKFIDMEFPDDLTVVWKSDKPQWIQPYYMAAGFWEYAKNIMKPAHYLKQFHPKYTSGKTYEDLQKADQWWITPGYPCLFAWCLGELSKDGQNYKFTRNPYYWRVDSEGNQLPYMDAIAVEIVSDEQVRILNCAQGKYDTAFRICGGPNEIPLLQEKAQAGNYKFLDKYMNGAGAWPGYMVNQYYVEGGKNYTDDTPEKAKEIRDVLRDKRFRQALSHGMDRQRMIDVTWNGIGDAKGQTLSPQSWHFVGDLGQAAYKKWSTSYTEFNADAANKLLDDAGLKKGADGFRTLPSGKPFELTLDISDWGGSLKVQADAAAEAKAQWEKNLGLKVKVNNLQGQPELDTRTSGGQYMLRGAHISEIDIWTFPDWLFPIVQRYMFPLEGGYYEKGKDNCKPDPKNKYSCGVKPDADSPAAKLQALYEKGQNTKTVEDRHKLVFEAIDVYVNEGPFVIGVSGDQPMPIIVKNYMRNVLNYGVVGPWAPSTPGNQTVSTWWMDK